MATASASRVLVLALASRLVVLGAMLLADWAFDDLDSSSRLQGYPCSGSSSGSVPPAGGQERGVCSFRMPPAMCHRVLNCISCSWLASIVALPLAACLCRWLC